MTRQPEGPNQVRLKTEEQLAADQVRAERKAKREAKAAAAAAKAAARKPGMSKLADSRRNTSGIAISASKATAVSRSIISRARGGRGR